MYNKCALLNSGPGFASMPDKFMNYNKNQFHQTEN